MASEAAPAGLESQVSAPSVTTIIWFFWPSLPTNAFFPFRIARPIGVQPTGLIPERYESTDDAVTEPIGAIISALEQLTALSEAEFEPLFPYTIIPISTLAAAEERKLLIASLAKSIFVRPLIRSPMLPEESMISKILFLVFCACDASCDPQEAGSQWVNSETAGLKPNSVSIRSGIESLSVSREYLVDTFKVVVVPGDWLFFLERENNKTKARIIKRAIPAIKITVFLELLPVGASGRYGSAVKAGVDCGSGGSGGGEEGVLGVGVTGGKGGAGGGVGGAGGGGAGGGGTETGGLLGLAVGSILINDNLLSY